MHPRSLPGTLLPRVLGAFVLGAVCQLSAANYYVDYSAGADTNVGTSSTTPWRHCPGDPAAAGAAGTTALVAGDTVHFKGGVAYVLTGATGIVLRASGAAGSPITFDGNSGGAWGTGKALLTDNNGAGGLTAFSAPAAVSYLVFNGFEFGAIGGAATLPIDVGSPAPTRFGAGLQFSAGVTNTTITGCTFHDLGYAFNQKPMNAASIAGVGIGLASCDTLTISNCDFSHVAAAIEMVNATSLANLTVTNCTFHDNVCWTVDLPPPPVAPANFVISGCTETNNTQFNAATWTGYGPSPRTDSATANAGDTVTFTVTAAASPAATFQWQKNGAAIAGATTNTLTLSAVSATDAATYTAVATNSAGTSTSNDAILTVAAATSGGTSTGTSSSTTSSTSTTPTTVPPALTTQPASQTVLAGATATFTAAASGTPAPTYQWRKNDTAIAGATAASLTLTNVTTASAGQYSVVATNSAGSATSSAATLTVNSAPAITTQPASQTVLAGATVTFTAAASGTPAPTYQWRKNGTAITGATAATLTLTNVSTADAAPYSVVATNSAGSAASSAATLTVNSAPAITTQPASQTVLAGATVTFTVAATGTPAPTYQWRKNGTAIAGATAATLTLPTVTTSDSAQYAVVATNVVSSVTSQSATLTVNSPPAFAVQPVSQTVTLHSNVTFSATVTGVPTPTLQWTRNDVAITGQTGTSLVLQSVAFTDAARYALVATNSVGTATSTIAALTVNPPGATNGGGNQSGGPSPTVSTGGTTGSTSGGATAGTGTAVPTTTTTSTTTTNTSNTTPTSTSTPSSTPTTPTPSTPTTPSNSSTQPTTAPSRLVNLSVRGFAGTGSNTLMLGFVVNGTSSPSLLIRGVGPTLQRFGVAGALTDPKLSLYTGGTVMGSNENWSGASNAAAIANLSGQVGAFALPAGSADAALLPTLVPGAYTAQIASGGGTGGVALLELYDALASSDARLINASVRTTVTAANAPIIGFVVKGTTSRKLLIRAVGPGLQTFGVDGVLSDPQLAVYRAGTVIAANDNWSGDASVVTAGGAAGAFPLNDPASRDAALVVDAAPGEYSVVVSGVNNAQGVVLVDIYEIP